MKGKIFVLSTGKHIFIRDADDVEVAFNSIEEFNTYYSGTIDLSSEYYIDYEPNRELLYKAAEGNFQPLENQWEGIVREYEDILADVPGMAAKLEDPYFGKTVKEAKEYKIQYIKSLTYTTIITHMPEWRQIRWRDYMRLHEAVQDGKTLNALDQVIYDGFPTGDETNDIAYNNCAAAMGWLMQCIAANDHAEAQVPACSTVKKVRDLPDPSYPEWRL